MVKTEGLGVTGEDFTGGAGRCHIKTWLKIDEYYYQCVRNIERISREILHGTMSADPMIEFCRDPVIKCYERQMQ